tara:strand:+ start:772 stop:951 length:180 start_codon:yes stop_codon:yes gene_type:complete
MQSKSINPEKSISSKDDEDNWFQRLPLEDKINSIRQRIASMQKKIKSGEVLQGLDQDKE